MARTVDGTFARAVYPGEGSKKGEMEGITDVL